MLKNNNERCIELNDGSEEATTTAKTTSNKTIPGNMNDKITAITTVHAQIAPSIHLAPLSTLISTPPASSSPPVLVVDDDEPCELAMESSESLCSESRIHIAPEAASVSGTSTSMAKALKDQTHTTMNQQQQKQLVKVAGPQQQQQQRQLSLQEKKRLRQQNPVEKIFPFVAITHQKLRALLARPIGSALQQQILKIINAYITGCRNEYEENTAYPYKCRRLAHSMTRTMDLMQQICASFEDTPEYIHRMIELVAIYMSCELRYAKEFKEHKPLIANRILHNIYKYLKGSNNDETMTYILRMFAHMPRMYREREVMTKIFQTLIPEEQITLQREFPDNLYIQYIIVFYHWTQLEHNLEEQMSVIEFANKFMRPAKTLCTNSTYAYHLPNYTCTQTATKFILHDLKFFHDLRNASIYDHRLKLGTEVIDISDEDQPKSSKTTVNVNFAELVQNAEFQPTTRPMVKLENQIVIATIDLTLEDKREDDLEWLQDLQRNAKKLEPAHNALSMLAGRSAILPNGKSAATSEVIEIDSDTEDEDNDNDDLEEPENLLLEEPEQLSDHFLDFEEPDQDDNLSVNSIEAEDSLTVKSNKSTDHIKPTTESQEINNDASSLRFTQQSTQVFPTKLNIISVRSIAATQTENNSNDSCLPHKSKVTSELLPAKSNTAEIRSIAATQTENSYCESAKESSAEATTQLLSAKPTIIEVRSIAKNQTNGNNNNCNSIASSTELEMTQINPQISKTFNADIVTESSKQAVTSVRNEVRLSRIDDSYLCRRDSLHLLSSPIRTYGASHDNNDTVVNANINASHAAADDDDNEMCFFGSTPHSRISTKTTADSDAFNSNKVIYSVAASTCPPLQQESTDFMSDDESPHMKQQSAPRNNVSQKKLVQFSNKLLQRTGGNPITHPIKPAIKNTNSTYNNQHTPINSAVSRFGSASPASSTSSLPRTFQKEHLSAFREHYTDAEKRQVLHRQCLPSHLHRNIKKCRTNTPHIAPSYSSSSSSNGAPYAPTKMTCKEMLLAAGSSNNGRHLHDCYSSYYQSLDENLRKKCCVVIERNYELDRNMVQSLNRLLQMQREKRQQALEKRQEAERQRVLQAKMLEEQMLKEQITELKRQQEEKKAKRRRHEHPKRKENKLAMRLQKRHEHQTAKMRQRIVSIDDRNNIEDTMQRSRVVCGIDYFSDSQASVKSTKQLPITNSGVNSQPKDIKQAKTEEQDEEELERSLLRTPTPERMLNAEVVTPKSATKPVKVRIKRIWQKNRIANEMRVLAKVQAQEEELESANQLTETSLEMQRIRKLVLAAKNKIRSQLLDKNVLHMYNDDRESDENEASDEIDVEEAVTKSAKAAFDVTPAADKRGSEQAPGSCNGSELIKELEPTSFVETAAAASGLAMLANTAATAAIAETQTPQHSNNPLMSDTKPSTSAAATALTKDIATRQQNHEDSDESVPPSQKLPNCCRISELAAAAGAAINHALGNQSNLTLINFEATPTVPAYLFNGESRDVPTPTPLLALPAAYTAAPTPELLIAETAPMSASVDSTHVPAERATRSSANANAAAATATVNTTLSTSDHEVSSTQETLCETLQLRSTNHSNALMMQTSSPNGNLSARRMSLTTATAATLSAALVGSAVQNNQVDTTHHLPESTTTNSSSSRSTRRRTRKLSTHDEISTAEGKEHNRQRHQPVHKRRKTICADASFRVQSPSELLAIAIEGHASSPSTTTVTVEKPTTRKRGRPAKGAKTSTPKHNPKRSGSNSTPPSLPKLVDDAIDTGALHCSSPGVSSKLMEKHIKHTYSLNNIVKNVFVPPEIEEYLENETDSKSSTSPPVPAAANPAAMSDLASTSSSSFSSSNATTSPKAGTSSSSTKPTTSSTKEKPKIKTVKGAKMKTIKNKQQQDILKVGDSFVEEEQQKQPKKLKTIKNASSGRSKR